MMRRLFILSIIFILPIQIFAQTKMWVARYDGPGHDMDHAFAIAVDDSGNVYVTGTSLDTNDCTDYATIKYNSFGDTVWVRRYNGPDKYSDDDAYAIAVDKNGNVYVTGRSTGIGTDYDYATVKYNSAGDEMWVRRYNYSSSKYWKDDYANAIAVDDSGNVYVTGRSDDSATIADYATIKYDSLGDTMWVRRYDSQFHKGEQAYAITVDNNGNVYVTGSSAGDSALDYATIKYNSAGDTVWVRRYSRAGKGMDTYEGLKEYDYINRKGFLQGGGGNAVAVDNIGNVYIAGGGGYATTIKYNSFGDTMWVRRYDGPDSTRWSGATALAIDNSGNVYITGASYGIGTDYDYVTIKYNNSGDTMWVRRYNGTGDSTDRARGIAVDNDGNVYVTGSSWGVGSWEDYATIKYSSSGSEEWVQRYNGSMNNEDNAYAIAVDKGYVYVTGSALQSTGYDYTTIKYSTVGIEENSNIKNQISKLEIIKDKIYLSVPNTMGADVKLYNLCGRLKQVVYSGTLSKGNYTFTPDVKVNGIYFVKFVTDNYKETKKLVLIK
jgi:uncharacterized delta-60 repeat protein